jgi:translin
MDLDSIRESATARLDETHRAREVGLRNCRRIIRASANAIRAFHRGEGEAFAGLVAEASGLLTETMEVLADHPDILHAGFVHDAAKEYAEAVLTSTLALGGSLPSPDDLGVAVPAYLNGLGEAVGELRRRMLDLLRSGDLDAAETTLGTMDEVVEVLASIDYPDGMTGGLRRTTDVARALVERSRSDLTTTIIQERLRRSLERDS